MKYVIIYPGRLKGNINIPPSKSICHRAIICAALSKGVSNIENTGFSQDIAATCNAVKCLGADIKRKGSSLIIKGSTPLSITNSYIDCFESGSTLRFLVPVAASLGGRITFDGRGNLAERPMQPYYDIFDAQKLSYKNAEGKLPLTIEGKLKPGDFMIKGNVSSQFISGLLLALPVLDGDSKIIVTSKLESRPYIDLTLEVMKAFGISVINNNYSEFIIKGNRKYKAADYTVEGDFSQAAFYVAADILGSTIECSGLNMDSLQGDKIMIDIVKSMGAEVYTENDKLKANSSKTKGIIIDASECPDLVPAIAVIGALGQGTTKIVNAGRLRFKECDRLAAISSELNKIGADIKEEQEGLIINGKDMLKGGMVDSCNDHRIAMAMAIASLKCTNPLIIKNAGCIKKSYPDFWCHFKKMGGKIDEWCVGE